MEIYFLGKSLGECFSLINILVIVKHTQKPTNCLSVFEHFVGLALKGLKARQGGSYFIHLIL